EVAIYNTPLTASDVIGHYNAALNGPAPALPPPPPPPPAYRDAVLGQGGLVSYWRLGEGSGTTALDSKGSSNGTYSSVTLGSSGAVVHDPDTAASFNGSTSKISLQALSAVTDFSVEGWTNLASGSVTNNTLYG